MNKIAKIKLAIFILGVSLIFWFLLTYRLTQTPPGINGDEAAIGYIAASIAKSGYDPTGRLLPVFTRLENSALDWKQPVTVYAEVLAFKILGTSYFNLRAVSVIFSIVSVWIIFFLIKEIFDFKSAIFGVLIFITTPIITIQSHLALENIALVPFVAIWLFLLLKYTQNRKIKYLIYAAFVLGISMYSYLAMRLIIPVLILITALYVLFQNKGINKRAIREIIIFSSIFIPFIILAIVLNKQYPGSIFANNRPQNIISYQQFLLPYLSSFDPSFLFITGDSTDYHSTGKQGMFLLASLPFFLVGLYQITKKKNPILFLALATFLFSPILFGLPGSIHRASRLLALIPPYIIISSLGFMSVWNIKRNGLGQLISLLLILIIILNYADFLKDYWYEYPNRVKSEFAKQYQLVFEKASELAVKNHLTPYIKKDFRSENPIAVDFFEQAYFLRKLSTWQQGDVLPEKSVVIVGFSPEMKSLQAEQIGDTEFAVLTNKK